MASITPGLTYTKTFSTVNSATFSVTVDPAQTRPAILISLFFGTFSGQTLTITYGSVSASQVIVSSTSMLQIYILYPTATGANNMVATWTGSARTGAITATVFYNVSPTLGQTGSGGATSTTASVSVVSDTNQIVYAAARNSNTANFTGDGAQTALTDNIGGAVAQRLSSAYKAGSSSTTLSWTLSSSAWQTLGVAVLPYPDARPVSVRQPNTVLTTQKFDQSATTSSLLTDNLLDTTGATILDTTGATIGTPYKIVFVVPVVVARAIISALQGKRYDSQ